MTTSWVSETHFHTIQSILKREASYLSASHSTAFPYYSVYFKARYMQSLIRIVWSNFHTIQSILKLSQPMNSSKSWQNFHTIQSILKHYSEPWADSYVACISILFSLF